MQRALEIATIVFAIIGVVVVLGAIGWFFLIMINPFK